MAAMSGAQSKIEQLLAEANRRAEQAEERAKQARQDAEQAKQDAEQAKQDAEQANQKIRPTTLQEYLPACQVHVLSRVVLDTEAYLTTRVPATKPTSKHCPRLIQPWDDFVETQQRINTCVDCVVPRDARLFESVHFLETAGERIYNRPVCGETALRYVQADTVEIPVRIIVNKLKDLHPEWQGLALFDGVHFQTPASSLRDKNDGNDETEQDEKLMTDQICVLRSGFRRSTAYVIEYKAPHRLHTLHLDKGLRPMNILDEVVNKPTIPTLDSEKLQHYAELLTAAAITQTYRYMLEAGLEYGCLANGDAIVFLKIDWTDPTVLLYHLAQPLREVEVDKDTIYSNAVCQLLAFTILALQSQQHGNDECVAVTNSCPKWMVDFDCMVEQIAIEEGPRTPTGKKHRRVPSSPEWLPNPVKKRRRSPEQHARSDRVLRSYGRRDDPGGSSGDGSSGGGGPGPSDGGDGDGSPSQHGHSSSAPGPATALRGVTGAAQSQTRPYCTPLCLLTLVSGRMLDNKCSNAVLHSNEQQTKTDKKASSLQRHPVSHARWMALLQEQLSKSLEKGVVVLGQEGACGALFQITLLQYGYTFVAKGVTGRAVPQLKHEEAVYQKLQPLQGRHIPVCLGSVDLRPLNQVYYYDFDVRLIYLLLMSYGGAPFRERPDAATEERLVALLKSVVREMHDLGVVHGDIRLPNVLQSPTGHFTVIDFDQALLLPPTDRDALGEIASNKRKRLPAVEDGEENKTSRAKQIVMERLGKQADRGNAASIFTSDGGRMLNWSSK